MLHHVLQQGVRLRLPEESDAPELYRLIDSERERLARWMPWAQAETEADALEWTRRVRRQLGENNGLQTVIEVQGAIAGAVGLHEIAWMHRSTSIGYWLSARHEGRGIMTAAVRAYVDYAFGTLALHRVELSAGVHNGRSRAVAERLGFHLDGILRHAERLPAGFHDLACYSLLAGEWAESANPAPGAPAARG